MSAENHKRMIQRGFCAITALIAVYQNLKGFPIVINDLERFDEGCAQNGYELEDVFANTIVVPGSTNVVTAEGEVSPDTVMRGRLEAAAILYVSSREKGLEPRVIILNSPWEHNNWSTVSYFREVVREMSIGKYYPSDVESNDDSINTSSGTVIVKRMSEQSDLGVVAFVTNQTHTCRQDASAAIYQIPNYEMFSAEDLIALKTGNDPIVLQLDIKGKERTKLLMMLFDNHSVFANFFKAVVKSVQNFDWSVVSLNSVSLK